VGVRSGVVDDGGLVATAVDHVPINQVDGGIVGVVPTHHGRASLSRRLQPLLWRLSLRRENGNRWFCQAAFRQGMEPRGWGNHRSKPWASQMKRTRTVSMMVQPISDGSIAWPPRACTRCGAAHP